MGKFRDLNNIFISLTLDSVNHSSLYEAARRLVDREIAIDKLGGRRSGFDSDKRNMSLLSNKKGILDLYSYRKCFTGDD